MGRIHTLHIACATLAEADIAALGRVHTLVLMCCSFLADVAPLRNVHNLSFAACSDVIDVSSLGKGRVHTLRLQGLRVANVSDLGTLHTLELANCERVTDVSALHTVRNLLLLQCANVSHMNVGGDAVVFSCENLRSITLAATARDISVFQCDNLTDFCSEAVDSAAPLPSSRSTYKRAALFSCARIADLGGLRGWNTVFVSVCPCVRDVSPLANATIVGIHNCARVDVSTLARVKFVFLAKCERLKGVPALARAQALWVKDCPRIADMKMQRGDETDSDCLSDVFVAELLWMKRHIETGTRFVSYAPAPH